MVVNCSKNFSLKFLQIEGRFPTQHREVPRLSVDFVAQQLNLAAAIWLDFPMKGSSNERVHSKIRAVMGFHPITTDDTARLQTYLREQIIPQDQDIRHLLSTALDWCQENKVEPPSEGRLMRLLKSSIHTFEDRDRNAGYPAPLAQIPACATNAPGSCLR